MYQRMVLEGSDLIGKTTMATMLNMWFPDTVSDRMPALSAAIGEFKYEPRGLTLVKNNPDTLFVILYVKDSTLLEERLEAKLRSDPFKVDDFDRRTALYNRVYQNFAAAAMEYGNVLLLAVDGKTSFDLASEIANKWLGYTVSELPPVTLEGESKVYRSIPGTGLALVSLKPTLYSFTHNRYGEVPGTDKLRQDFWSFFGSAINRAHMDAEGHVRTNLPSSFVTEFMLDGVTYAVARFWDQISPLEVVWKNYLVGTTKHDLHGVDQVPTLSGKPIQYEGKFPASIIRFDWRNPLPHQDKCIPDDFAAFYMNVESAKRTARFATKVIADLLESQGYELVDLCYFMNKAGTQICGEISPDGMRIKKRGASYDKDLWRQGKAGSLICQVWSELYLDVSSVADCMVLS